MVIVPRWRNLCMLRNCSSSSSSSSSITQLAYIHSTPISCAIRKIKWNNDGKKTQAHKNEIKFSTRQKRADTKRALKDLLFHYGSSHASVRGEESLWTFGEDSEKPDNKGRKLSQQAAKSQQKKIRRKTWNDSSSEDDDIDWETINRAKKWSTWSYDPFQSSTFEFEWRDQSDSNWSTNRRTREWDTASESESDVDVSCTVGSSSDRIVLGLPSTGPLKIEDVKAAITNLYPFRFRSSALKWHPDKHQGPSQAMAEEKFKLCVNAYNSLRNAFA
ncbi:hypothetical protein ACFE04_018014 [Oxalis oulophora]